MPKSNLDQIIIIIIFFISELTNLFLTESDVKCRYMSFALTRLIEIHAKKRKEGGWGGLLLEQGCQRSGVQIQCSVFHNVSVYWLPEYKERESETENQRVQLNRLIISPEPIFHTLIPRRGPAHG